MSLVSQLSTVIVIDPYCLEVLKCLELLGFFTFLIVFLSIKNMLLEFLLKPSLKSNHFCFSVYALLLCLKKLVNSSLHSRSGSTQLGRLIFKMVKLTSITSKTFHPHSSASSISSSIKTGLQ